MEIFFHTISLEPARWTPQRVSRPLIEWLPRVAGAGFRKVEVYEPHLAMAPDEAALMAVFSETGLEPVILSSYLKLAEEDEALYQKEAAALHERVTRCGFRQVRLFPGSRVSPEDEATIAIVRRRIEALAHQQPEVSWLLETHDHSIADSPQRLVGLLEEIGRPQVGILFQPTRFQHAETVDQLETQRPWIRHFHLQNRDPEMKLTSLEEGEVRWRDLLSGGDPSWSASLEFFPRSTIQPFEFEAALAEAVSEASLARTYL